MTVALAVPPLTVKNRPCALIRSSALNHMNTLCIFQVFLSSSPTHTGYLSQAKLITSLR